MYVVLWAGNFIKPEWCRITDSQYQIHRMAVYCGFAIPSSVIRSFQLGAILMSGFVFFVRDLCGVIECLQCCLEGEGCVFLAVILILV